jgi:hypothetical protein
MVMPRRHNCHYFFFSIEDIDASLVPDRIPCVAAPPGPPGRVCAAAAAQEVSGKTPRTAAPRKQTNTRR